MCTSGAACRCSCNSQRFRVRSLEERKLFLCRRGSRHLEVNMTDMANRVFVKPAALTPSGAVHIVQADASQCLLTAWRPTQVHERPWDCSWVWDAWRHHIERDAAAGAIVPFVAQTRNAQPMGSAPPGWPCTCSWSPSRLSVPNSMRKCGLSCVVQLRAQVVRPDADQSTACIFLLHLPVASSCCIFLSCERIRQPSDQPRPQQATTLQRKQAEKTSLKVIQAR